MGTALCNRGGWFSDNRTSTGAVPGMVLLVAGLIACTGTGSLSNDIKILERVPSPRSFLSSSVNNYDVQVKYVRTPNEDLLRIREIFKPAVSDLARCFKVSRQAIYNWQNGEQPSIEHADKLRDLALAADMFVESGKSVSGYSLKRKIVNGKNLIEVVKDGGSAIDAARLLLHILGQEEGQKKILSTRFTGRSASQSFADSDLMQENDKA
jgi:hypothetical protein